MAKDNINPLKFKRDEIDAKEIIKPRFFIPSPHYNQNHLQTKNKDFFDFNFPSSLSRKIKGVCQQKSIGIDSLLFLIFTVLFSKYSTKVRFSLGLLARKQMGYDAVGSDLEQDYDLIPVDLSNEPSFEKLLSDERWNHLVENKISSVVSAKISKSMKQDHTEEYPNLKVLFIPNDYSKLASENKLRISLKGLLEIGTLDFVIQVVLVGNRIKMRFYGNPLFFNFDNIRTIFDNFRNLSKSILESPGNNVLSHGLLTEGNIELIFNECHRESIQNSPKLIHKYFEEQVDRYPNNIAVEYKEKTITYRELNNRANQFGSYLQKLGIGKEDIIGVCLNRSINLIIVLLGILKAGGAYLPLDPKYPESRLAFMMQDAKVKVVITDTLLNFVSDVSNNITQIQLGKEWHFIEKENKSNLDSYSTAESLAYVIYTSGSTGLPKGVSIEHKNTSALISWAKKYFEKSYFKSVLASSSICFDLSIFEIFTTLANGGKVFLVDNILQLLSTKKTDLTLINTVPSAISHINSLIDLPDTLKVITLAGEPLRPSLVNKLYDKKPKIKVFDLYGPTEDTTYTTAKLRKKNGIESIGSPIDNTQVLILDPFRNILPIGIPGELYIGGSGVARGYLYRPQLNSEKFLKDDRFSRYLGSRIYKTGDLAYWLPYGEIKLLGRMDEQVKIRGFRIELGEIEECLISCDNVQDAAVIVSENKNLDNGKSLIAFIVVRKDKEISKQNIQQYLKGKLPEYMIPSKLVFLEKLPLTPSGKVDKKELKKKTISTTIEGKYVPSKTNEQRMMGEIWKSILNLDKVSIHDDFFNLGGHSLLMLQVIARCKDNGIVITPQQFLRNPTIYWLTNAEAKIPINTEGTESKVAFLLPVQKSVFNFDFNHQKFITYKLYECTESINAEGISAAAKMVVKHHEALRSSFTDNSEKFYIRDEEQSIIFNHYSHFNIPINESSVTIRSAAAQIAKSINLVTGPLIKFALFDFADSKQIILILVSHLVADGISLDIIKNDLESFYIQNYQKESSHSVPKTSSILSYSNELQKLKNQENFPELISYWTSIDCNRITSFPIRSKIDGEPNSLFTTTLDGKRTADLFENKSRRYPSVDLILASCLVGFHFQFQLNNFLFRMSTHGRTPMIDNIDLSHTVGFLSTSSIINFNFGDYISDQNFLESVTKQRKIPPPILFWLGYLYGTIELKERLNNVFSKTEVSINISIPTSEKSETSLFVPRTLNLGLGIKIPSDPKIRIIVVCNQERQLLCHWLYQEEYFSEEDIRRLATLSHNFLIQYISLS